nr:hypothetical protein [Candidatus Sigynarchaeota archaeon]
MVNEPTRDIAICFTQGHSEKLVIEQVQHEGLVDMLFRSGYKLGKIETWISWQKLCDYQVLVIGAPQETAIEEMEIKAIIEFVKNGGSLLMLSDAGADELMKSNLNVLAREFGIEFKPVILSDEKSFSEKSEYVAIDRFERHFITRDVTKIIYASGCTVESTDKNALVIARAGTDAVQRARKNDAWAEPESAAGAPVMLVKRHGEGKVVAIGNFSIITSISKTYGLYAADNFTLIGNLFAWLVNRKIGDADSKTDMVYFNTAIDAELFYWIERELKKKRFPNVNALINFSLKATRDTLDKLDKQTKADSKVKKKKERDAGDGAPPSPHDDHKVDSEETT